MSCDFNGVCLFVSCHMHTYMYLRFMCVWHVVHGMVVHHEWFMFTVPPQTSGGWAGVPNRNPVFLPLPIVPLFPTLAKTGYKHMCENNMCATKRSQSDVGVKRIHMWWCASERFSKSPRLPCEKRPLWSQTCRNCNVFSDVVLSWCLFWFEFIWCFSLGHRCGICLRLPHVLNIHMCMYIYARSERTRLCRRVTSSYNEVGKQWETSLFVSTCGWCAVGWKRKRFRMVQEGSCFRPHDQSWWSSCTRFRWHDVLPRSVLHFCLREFWCSPMVPIFPSSSTCWRFLAEERKVFHIMRFSKHTTQNFQSKMCSQAKKHRCFVQP